MGGRIRAGNGPGGAERCSSRLPWGALRGAPKGLGKVAAQALVHYYDVEGINVGMVSALP